MKKNLTQLNQKLIDAKGIIFDMDGTIVDLEKLHLFVFEDTFKTIYELPFSKELYIELVAGKRIEEGLEAYLENVGHSIVKIEEAKQYFREKKKQALEENIDELVELKSGAAEFLGKLNSLGKGVALGTSARMFAVKILLKHFDLVRYFDYFLMDHHVSDGKPDSQVFEVLQYKLGASNEETVIFEDSSAGIDAALGSGAFVCAMHNPGWNDEPVKKAQAVIDSFDICVDMLN